MATATLTPTASVVGTVVLVEAKPYDFTSDATGERNAGISYRLHLIVDEPHGKALQSLKMAQAIGPDAREMLKPGMVVQANATGFARARGRSAVIEYTVREVIDTKTGDLLVRQPQS